MKDSDFTALSFVQRKKGHIEIFVKFQVVENAMNKNKWLVQGELGVRPFSSPPYRWWLTLTH